MEVRILSFLLLLGMAHFANAQSNSTFCNGDFDNQQLTTQMGLYNNSKLTCWNTTASDGQMEIWASGYNGVPSYSGYHFAELNANMVATMYQDITVTPGGKLNICFAHRGRAGSDVMSVSVGPVGGTYTTLGVFTDGQTWRYYSLQYTVPSNMGNVYSVRFNSVSAALGNPGIGNFLDAVTVTQAGNSVLSGASSCSGTTTGMEPSAKMNYSFFPNPFATSAVLTLQEEVSQAELILYNNCGQRVYAQANISGKEIHITRDKLPAGIYLMHLVQENRVLITDRIIVREID